MLKDLGRVEYPDTTTSFRGDAMLRVTGFRVAIGVAVLFSVTVPNEGHCQWSATGSAICTETHQQYGPETCSDGQGGAFVAWNDERNGASPGSVYMQHLLQTGQVDPSWPANGMLISNSALLSQVHLVDDAAGGAIVVWDTNSGAFAQRVGPSGQPAVGWAGGVFVLPESGDELLGGAVLSVISDGAGGIFAASSYDRGTGTGSDILALHITASGAVASGWPSSGAVVTSAAGGQYQPTIARGPAGGVYVAWTDGTLYTGDIYAAQVGPAGNVAWTVPVCTKVNMQAYPQATPDATGGVYVCWQDERSSLEDDIYGTHLQSNGTLASGWPTDGWAITTSFGYQQEIAVTTGTTGDLYLCWTDKNDGGDIWADRLGASPPYSGSWGQNGIPVCNAQGVQEGPRIAADSSGGVVIMWGDNRPSAPGVYAERIGPGGSVLSGWVANGTLVSPTGGQGGSLVGDSRDGAIFAWADNRSGNGNLDIYADRINSIGFLAPSTEWIANGAPIRLGRTGTLAAQFLALPDGAGGSYFAWTDSANGAPAERVLRIDSSGYPHASWPAGGRQIGTDATASVARYICSDAAGGVYVLGERWLGQNNNPEVLRRIDSSGNVSSGWPGPGLTISQGSSPNVAGGLLSDGAGGCMALWDNLVSMGAYGDLYAQRFSPTGVPQWTTPGIKLTTSPDAIGSSTAIDGQGGYFVAWWRGSPTTGFLRVQRLTSSGQPLWAAGGIEVSDAAFIGSMGCQNDGTGGALLFFSGLDLTLRVQHINSTGAYAPGFSYGGHVVPSPAGAQYAEESLPDGSGGVVGLWTNRPQGPYSAYDNIYAQHILSDGSVDANWPSAGLGLTVGTNNPQIYDFGPEAVSDGLGGALITWWGNSLVHVSRVLSVGTIDPAFPTNGTSLVTASGDRGFTAVNVRSPGVATVGWLDARDSPTGTFFHGVYAQAVTFDVTPPAVSSLAILAGSTSLAISWTAPGDDGTTGTAAAYDLRYSQSPITAQNFLSAVQIPTNAPQTAGSTECALLDGLPHCRTYYFAIRTRDECYNWSQMSTCVAAGDCAHGMEVDCGGGLKAVQYGDSASVGQLALSPPWPNPCVSGVEFSFEIPTTSPNGEIEIKVYDAVGREVRTIARGAAPAGVSRASWDLLSSSGSRVRGGVYFLRLRYAGTTLRRTIVVR